MTIETKYNPGQEVWVMEDNQPVKLFIDSINIVASVNNDKKIVYRPLYNLANGCMGGKFNEDDICATKEDLKNKLFG